MAPRKRKESIIPKVTFFISSYFFDHTTVPSMISVSSEIFNSAKGPMPTIKPSLMAIHRFGFSDMIMNK